MRHGFSMLSKSINKSDLTFGPMQDDVISGLMFIVALDSCQILFLFYRVGYITAKRTFLYAKLTEMLWGEVAVFVSCTVGYSYRPDLAEPLSPF